VSIVERFYNVVKETARKLGHFKTEGMPKMKYAPDQVDFVPHFLNRWCATCSYFKHPNFCAIAPKLSVDFQAGCDGYYPSPEYIQAYGHQQLSRRYQEILESAPHGDQDTKRKINYWEKLVGVCCGSCRHVGLPDTTQCEVVDTKISIVGCCEGWHPVDFMGLRTEKDGYEHGGNENVLDPTLHATSHPEYSSENVDPLNTETTPPVEKFVQVERKVGNE